MADAKSDLITFLSACADDVLEAVIVLRTVNGVAVCSSTEMKNAQVLIKEGSDWIGLREKSGFNRNVDCPKS